MVVQHNMQAANASRMLGITSGNQAKSTEKLSSGFRINRAADDAAGLSISEKMRKQIRGLDQASTNAQDGVSAVQTAEGALTEVHSMLQRMNELAVQAANGTNSQTDRKSIQDEIDQLTTEIDRVAETTKFNETYLLKGDPDDNKVTKAVKAHDAGLNGDLTELGGGTTKFTLKEQLKNGDSVTIAGKDYTIGTGKTDESYKTTTALSELKAEVGNSINIDGKEYTLTNNVKVSDITNSSSYTPNEGDQIITKDGTVYQYYVKTGDTNYTGTAATNASTNVDTGWYEKSGFKDTALYNAEGHNKAISSIAVEGSTLKLKAAESHSGLKEFNIVKRLDDGDISAYQVGDSGNIKVANFYAAIKDDTTNAQAASPSATTSYLKAGDSLTQKGETVTAVKNGFTSTAYADVTKHIGSLKAGEKVTVTDIDGNNAVTYTVVEKSTEEIAGNNELTREHISELLQEGQRVSTTNNQMPASGSFSGTAQKYTVAGVDAADEDKISANRAYTLMADELQKASSIGTDTEAKVTNNNDGSFIIKQGTVTYTDKLTFGLHVGADADMTNKINVDVNTMNSAYLGVKGLNVNDDTGMAATYAIDAIADAVAKVSEQRSALGAVQNRLEHTIANVDNVVENSNAAESRIRDTDMADEMVTYSKNNILAQAGQAMLAQANQATQGVLSILG